MSLWIQQKIYRMNLMNRWRFVSTGRRPCNKHFCQKMAVQVERSSFQNCSCCDCPARRFRPDSVSLGWNPRRKFRCLIVETMATFWTFWGPDSGASKLVGRRLATGPTGSAVPCRNVSICFWNRFQHCHGHMMCKTTIWAGVDHRRLHSTTQRQRSLCYWTSKSTWHLYAAHGRICAI